MKYSLMGKENLLYQLMASSWLYSSSGGDIELQDFNLVCKIDEFTPKAMNIMGQKLENTTSA